MAKVTSIFRTFDAIKKFPRVLKNLFLKKPDLQTTKRDFNFRNIFVLLGLFMITFVTIVLFLPTQETIKFHEVAKNPTSVSPDNKSQGASSNEDSRSSKLWASPTGATRSSGGGIGVSQNTPMQVLPRGGNSHAQLHAGTHLRVRIVDKFVVSQEPVPVLGRIMEDATTESGLKISEGSLLYGEASYQKSSGRALVRFRKLSYPSGEIRNISATVIGDDSMPGITGVTHSDGIKNSAGQFVTTFVGALAAGSVQRDFLGNSQGGLQNGLLMATSEVAKDRAQKYGENLKAAREWIEIGPNSECEAIIDQSFQMIESEVNQ
jgi:hypothetical protein